MSEHRAKIQRVDEEEDAGQADPEFTAIAEGLGKLDSQFVDELFLLELKFYELRKPFYDRRREWTKNIPNFWEAVLSNFPKLAPMLQDQDHNILSFVKDLYVQESRDGFEITFTFGDGNPLFTEKEVKMNVPRHKEGSSEAERKRTVSKITWAQARRKELEDSLFFSIWENPEDEITMEIADMIRQEVFPHAFDFLEPGSDFGDGEEDEFDDDGEDDGGDGEEGNDDDEDEEEEEEEEEDGDE